MKRQIDKKLLFQILLAIAVCVLITIASGCRTGGVKLNPNSAGKIIQPKSPKQINEETKAKREESPKFKPLAPIPIIPPARTHTNAAKSNPVIPEPQSAKAETKPNTIKPSIPETEFKPSVTTEFNLPPVKISEGSTTVLIPILPESKGTNDSGKIIANEKTSPQMNWLQLFSLFMILFTGALILWIVYDLIKDSLTMKRQGTPIKDHLKNLKKPAKATRGSRKQSVAKGKPKKSTNKKSTKKKSK